MRVIDLNCDMGEGMPNDEALMPFINSANIACGFHAGSGDTIRRTIDLCVKYNVHIGAHPSFRDRENFGRKEIQIPLEKLYAIILEQLIKVDLIAKEKGLRIHHIKPHGALYNMAARDAKMSRTIAQAVKDFDDQMIFYGLSNSFLISEAKALGLKTASEVFADRTYQDDGTLTPRSEINALIENEHESIKQVLQMVKDGTVISLSGRTISIEADTICIHGDGRHAVSFAKRIHQALQENFAAPTI
jgi:UPF0271 protein